MARTTSDRQTRILYLSNLFYPDPWNGIMEHMRLLIEALDLERYEPLVAVRPDDGDQTRTLAQRTGARMCQLASGRSVAELRSLCRAESVDLVHIQTPTAGGVTRLALAASLGGVRSIVVTYQLAQSVHLPFRSRVFNRFVHRFLINRTIAVSGGVADTLEANGGIERSKIEIVYNAAEPYGVAPATPPFSRSPEEFWVGFFGRLAQEKGVRYLLDAFALLRERHAQARLILVGDGYEREALEAKTRQLDLTNVIRFAGYQPDARAWMHYVDLVVLPSLTEGLPYVLVEAMDAARPIVATRIPGNVEAVDDGVTGLLVPPEDADALAAAISGLVNDPSRRERFGTAGRQRFVQHFSKDQMVRRVFGIYDEVLTHRVLDESSRDNVQPNRS